MIGAPAAHKVDFVAAPWPIPAMLFAIPFPEISPEVVSITLAGRTFSLYWYALAYIAGILIGWRIAVVAVKSERIWAGDPPMTPRQVEDFLTWIILGIILGGRLGYVVFYQPAYFLANPLEIVAVWQGGMAFHGGFLGVVLAIVLYARKTGVRLSSLADILAISTAPGILLGRVANFVNAELWGRPSDVPWAVIFPGQAAQDCPGVVGPCARHPSQLYEAGLEGLLVGALLLFFAFRRGWFKAPWRLTAVFFIGYGVSRFIVEFFRQADAQFITADNPWGHVIRLGELGVTMGQLLSLPMVLIGVLLLLWSQRASATPGP